MGVYLIIYLIIYDVFILLKFFSVLDFKTYYLLQLMINVIIKRS